MTEVKFMVLEFNFNGSWIVCVVSYSKKKIIIIIIEFNIL